MNHIQKKFEKTLDWLDLTPVQDQSRSIFYYANSTTQVMWDAYNLGYKSALEDSLSAGADLMSAQINDEV